MTRRRKFALAGVALLLVTSLTTACTLSLGSGVAGILVTLALSGLLFGLGGASSGCDDSSTGACLSIEPCLGAPKPDGGADAKADMNPDGHVGPCLSPPQGDLGPDGHVGPCLDPLPPDLGPDGPAGPCLSPLPPDMGPDGPVGPCLSPPPPDAAIGPCLSLPPADASAALGPEGDTSDEDPQAARRALLARHGEALPEDVRKRLS